MKNTIVIIFLACICAVCAGCSANVVPENENYVTDTKKNDEITDSSTEEHMQDVPQILAFDSFEKIAELKAILNEEETQIVNYLNSKGYSMNGLTSKDDVVKMFDEIGDLNMLYLDQASGYELAGISYYVSYGYVMSSYINESEMIRFFCYIGATDERIDTAGNESATGKVVGNLNVGNKSLNLYNVEDEKSPFAFKGYIKTSNSRITVLVTNNSKRTTENPVEANVLSAPLSELISE